MSLNEIAEQLMNDAASELYDYICDEHPSCDEEKMREQYREISEKL